MTAQRNRLQLAEIEASELNQKLNLQEATLLDVRKAGEYVNEYIAGSISMPLSDFNPSQVVQIGDRPLVLCCQSGIRSSQASEKLRDYELTNVMQPKGGLSSWKASGFKTQIDRSAPINLFRQVQIVAGSLVAIEIGLGVLVSPWFLLLSGFMGCGLVFAGIINTCAMGILLMKLPYNQRTLQS